MSMDELTFPKDKVLEALRQNREEHLTIVKEAQTGYREKLIALLEENLEDAKAGEEVQLPIHLPLPTNHVKDFDRTIEMLELCEEDVVVLSQQEFQCYVRGQWHWRDQFLMSNMDYSGSATTAYMSELKGIE